jgi:thioredoxin-like negative regulator of GroEL
MRNLLSFFTIGLAVCSLGVAAETNVFLEQQTKYPETPPPAILKHYLSEKLALARKISSKQGTNLSIRAQDFFRAAANGDWLTTSNLFSALESSNHVAGGAYSPPPYWGAIHEAFGGYELFHSWNSVFLNELGNGIVRSIPPRSIYFGGTSGGRFAASVFDQGHAFFTLTQNALADGSYLAYLKLLYGDKIYIPDQSDFDKCSAEYTRDVQARMDHDQRFPGEPRQIRPGEDVLLVDGKVKFAGMVSGMAGSALLAKVIFDKNQDHQFYYEESFPLDWMHPYLVPHQFIFKLNRMPLEEFPPEAIRADREFWTQRVDAWLGAWLRTDTPLSKVADFARQTYVAGDLRSFEGDPQFIRDSEARQQFSKLRSSIAGLYAWRLGQCPPEYRPKSDDQRKQLIQAADLAFKQAFAVCPHSPEAVFRYVNFLLQFNRTDDALVIAQTCLTVAPSNDQVRDLVNHLQDYSTQRAGVSQVRADFQRLENEVRNNPTNFAAGVELARAYYQRQQPARAAQVVDAVLNNSHVTVQAVIGVAQICMQVSDWPKLEFSLGKLTKLSPDSPEAWYDLAALKAYLHKNEEAISALAKVVELSTKRLQHDPKARDLVAEARKDERFAPLRQLSDFKTLVP